MRTERIAAATVGALAVLVLAGCSLLGGTTAPVPASSSPAASPSPTAVAPLACGDLASDDDVSAALSATGGHQAVTPTSAPDASVIGARSIEGAGGLSCTWTTGPQAGPDGPAWMTVSLLPDAADDWSAILFGDGPNPNRRTFAGVSAAADCGDPGCGASMVVGTTWVRVDVLSNGLASGGSVFGRETTDTILTNAQPAIESVVTAVQGASAAQLRFPNRLPAAGAAADCAAALPTAALARAMGVTSATYDTSHQPTGVSDSIVGAAEHRIGTRECFAEGSGDSPDGIARILLDPGQAWAVADLAGDTAALGDLRPTSLSGMPSGGRALSDCTGSGSQCTLVLTIGDDAVQIDDTANPVPIAEAMLAAAR